ncbi:hypothetical protein HETIRDRAFT_233267, partial [Heterobasidion irregulare TC 32-1]
EGGVHWKAQAASHSGHEAIARLLLDRGAEVNAQEGEYGNALQAASCFGRDVMLLEKGAEVDARRGNGGFALQAASQGGHETVVKLLLDRGAEVNAQRVHKSAL